MKTKEFFQQVSLNEIQPNEANVRECFDNASIQELADSIQNSGLINPAYPSGGREKPIRHYLRRTAFPCRPITRLEIYQRLHQGCNSGRGTRIVPNRKYSEGRYFPIEEAKAYEKLLQTSGDINELISRTGKSEKYIRVRLKLNHLIADFAELLQTGEIGIGVAAVICEYSEEIQKDVHSRFFDKTSYSNWFNLPQEAVKKRIESNYTSCLKDYKFNKQECASCPHNTANFSAIL